MNIERKLIVGIFLIIIVIISIIIPISLIFYFFHDINIRLFIVSLISATILSLLTYFIVVPSLHFINYGKWPNRYFTSIIRTPKKTVILFMCLSWLLATFFLFLYPVFIKYIDNIQDIFILTLTLLLVYGTFSLLIFTFSLVLKTSKNELILGNRLKPENINFGIIETINSGVSFLFAAIFASIGFLMIYIALLFSKMDGNMITYLDNILLIYWHYKRLY